MHLSTDGTGGLASRECKFVGACETHRAGLNIADHLPKGLKLYSFRRSALIDRVLAYSCESQTVAMVLDCKSRLPLYVAAVIMHRQSTECGG